MKNKQYRISLPVGSGEDGSTRLSRWKDAAKRLSYKTISLFIRETVDNYLEQVQEEQGSQLPKPQEPPLESNPGGTE